MHTRRVSLRMMNRRGLFFLVTPFICQKIPSVKPLIPKNKPSVRKNYYSAGFTLIELIVTLTIAGILIGFAGPSMRSFVFSQRLSSQTNELVADFNFARSEAIKRANNVAVCTSSNGTSCSGNWQNGWITFVDADNSRTWTSGDSIVRIHESMPTGVAVNSSASIVVFDASGLLANGTGAGDYILCSSQTGKSRTINITSTGRYSTGSGTC